MQQIGRRARQRVAVAEVVGRLLSKLVTDSQIALECGAQAIVRQRAVLHRQLARQAKHPVARNFAVDVQLVACREFQRACLRRRVVVHGRARRGVIDSCTHAYVNIRCCLCRLLCRQLLGQVIFAGAGGE